jgi:hypothetical protein
MKDGQRPKRTPWHEDWRQMMKYPAPIWVTVDGDNESVRSDRVVE